MIEGRSLAILMYCSASVGRHGCCRWPETSFKINVSDGECNAQRPWFWPPSCLRSSMTELGSMFIFDSSSLLSAGEVGSRCGPAYVSSSTLNPVSASSAAICCQKGCGGVASGEVAPIAIPGVEVKDPMARVCAGALGISCDLESADPELDDMSEAKSHARARAGPATAADLLSRGGAGDCGTEATYLPSLVGAGDGLGLGTARKDLRSRTRAGDVLRGVWCCPGVRTMVLDAGECPTTATMERTSRPGQGE
mmetsp:Transcript_37927/g.66868  ORF Transcript_37927/g.66868 Transcript_37927/m.66868 type:complete len:252 (-) Transcript_37927:1223-1978(-)